MNEHLGPPVKESFGGDLSLPLDQAFQLLGLKIPPEILSSIPDGSITRGSHISALLWYQREQNYPPKLKLPLYFQFPPITKSGPQPVPFSPTMNDFFAGLPDNGLKARLSLANQANALQPTTINIDFQVPQVPHSLNLTEAVCLPNGVEVLPIFKAIDHCVNLVYVPEGHTEYRVVSGKHDAAWGIISTDKTTGNKLVTIPPRNINILGGINDHYSEALGEDPDLPLIRFARLIETSHRFPPEFSPQNYTELYRIYLDDVRRAMHSSSRKNGLEYDPFQLGMTSVHLFNAWRLNPVAFDQIMKHRPGGFLPYYNDACRPPSPNPLSPSTLEVYSLNCINQTFKEEVDALIMPLIEPFNSFSEEHNILVDWTNPHGILYLFMAFQPIFINYETMYSD